MESRPCKACGWPESTHPGEKALRDMKRRRARREEGEVEDEGCCSQGCSWLLALGGSAGLYAFWQVGAKNRWTSDGPGMLFIYLAVGVCALAALFGWFSVVYGAIRGKLPSIVRDLIEDP